MKTKMTLLLIMLVLSLATYSQTDKPSTKTTISEVEEITNKSNGVVYAMIVGSKWMKNITITIDFGQERRFISQNGQVLIDEESGKNLKFNSMIDALNYMAQRGWEFVDAYVVTTGSQNVYNWVIQKKFIVN